MIALFVVLLVGPYRAFLTALDAGTPPTAAKAINQIRWSITVNLALGVATVVIGATGGYWG
jgi:uncharacterized membrane protein